MAKFFRLIQNEYVKILRKTSTWIMLILVVVAGVGFSLISLVAKASIGDSESGINEADVKASYENDITYAKETKYEGWEDDVKFKQYLIDQKIYDTESWQFDAARTLSFYWNTDKIEEEGVYSAAQAKDIATDIESSLQKNDWKAYYQFVMDNNKKHAQASGTEDGLEVLNYTYQYCLNHEIEPVSSNEVYSLVQDVQRCSEVKQSYDEQMTAGNDVAKADYKSAEDELLLAKYRLEHDVTFDVSQNISWVDSGKFSFWSVFGASSNVIGFIGVLMIVIAGGIVASEFTQGTIKFLLINPSKRWKILTSKYVTSITFGYLMLLVLYLISMITALVLYGGGNLPAPFLMVRDGAVCETSGFLYVLKDYMLSSINILVMSTLAFAISSVVRSSALAIGVSMFAMFGGNTLVAMLGMLKLDWARYLIFSNTDLAGIAAGESPFFGHTVGFALIVVAVHMFVFLLTAWDGFVRREV